MPKQNHPTPNGPIWLTVSCGYLFHQALEPGDDGAIGGVHVARDAVQGARHTRAIVGGPAATQQLVLVEGVQPESSKWLEEQDVAKLVFKSGAENDQQDLG